MFFIKKSNQNKLMNFHQKKNNIKEIGFLIFVFFFATSIHPQKEISPSTLQPNKLANSIDKTYLHKKHSLIGNISFAQDSLKNPSTHNGVTKVLAPEICNNGIDDDGDGLIDCEDPDCGSTGTVTNITID